MTLPEMIDKLHDAGFVVTWNDSHDTALVSLSNRKPSVMEVVTALGFQPHNIISSGNNVMIWE